MRVPARRLPATGSGNKPVNSANLDMRWSPSRTSNFKHRTWIAGLIAWTVSHRTGSIRIRATWACDQVPTHLSAELIFATAWSGAAICSYGMTWGNRQPPSSQQLEQNSSPPQKKKQYHDVTIPHLLQHACVACASLWASPLPSPSAPNPQMPSGLWSLDRSNQTLTKTDGLDVWCHWRWGFLRQKFGELLWLNCCAYKGPPGRRVETRCCPKQDVRIEKVTLTERQRVSEQAMRCHLFSSGFCTPIPPILRTKLA